MTKAEEELLDHIEDTDVRQMLILLIDRVERLERFRSCYDPTFRPFNLEKKNDCD